MSGTDAIIFNGISIPHNLTLFQAGNGAVHGKLHILRQRRRHATHIYFVGMKSFRFYKHLMPVLICKLNHLILNGGTISGACTLDNTGINGGSVKILPDNLMGLFIGIGEPTGDLRFLHRFRVCGKRKRYHHRISQLFLHLGIIYTSSVHPGRSPCLKTTYFYAHLLQGIRQVIGSLQPIRSCVSDGFPAKTSGFQISTRTQNHGPAFIDGSCKSLYPCHPLFI